MAVAPFMRGITDVAWRRLVRTSHTLSARAMLSWSDLIGANGPLPDRILADLPLLTEADPETARDLRRGFYTLAGEKIVMEGGTAPWLATPPSDEWAEELHGFGWIAHFNALEDDEAQAHIRWLITGWLNAHGRWNETAWRPHVTAHRLMAWMTHGKLIFQGADLVWRSTTMRSIARQAHHLYRTAAHAPEGEERLAAAIGLAVSGLGLPNGDKRRKRGLALTVEELNKQILPDGGHVSRSPRSQLRLLSNLIRLKAAADARRSPLPEPIHRALDRIIPMVRFFRHGDGRLAHFNGTPDLPPGLVDTVLALDETHGQPLLRANQSGFQRVARGRSLIIMDTGPAPEGILGTESHAGCLSFELSSGPHRIFVNCGATDNHGSQWHDALRSTAAHSTVTVDDTSSCAFLSGARSSLFGDGRVLSGPEFVKRERKEGEDGTVVEASHDGYANRFGLIHRRTLYMNARGDDIRGEDTLVPDNTRSSRRNKPRRFAARFHLHPDIRASLAWDKASMLIILPNGDSWQFLARGGVLRLEDSAYMDHRDTVRQTRQIVIEGSVTDEAVILKWALKRMSKPMAREISAARSAAQESPAQPAVETDEPAPAQADIKASPAEPAQAKTEAQKPADPTKVNPEDVLTG